VPGLVGHVDRRYIKIVAQAVDVQHKRDIAVI